MRVAACRQPGEGVENGRFQAGEGDIGRVLLHQGAGEGEGLATELIVAKNRHGATGTVEMTFDKEFTRFRCVEKDYGDEQ